MLYSVAVIYLVEVSVMRVVVRVGGSVVASPLNASLIGKYVDLLKDLRKQGHEVVAVIGGGSLAREFIRVAAELDLEEAQRDWAAIHVSRLLAQLFVAVAAMIGERVKADLLVKGSNVDGIFTKDPKKYSDAKKLDALRFEDLTRLLEADQHRAGINQIIDPEAVKILRKIRLKTVVVNGYDAENVLLAVKGEPVGTVIE